MIRMINVDKRYGGGHTVTALDKVSLELLPGEFLVVTGPSGSGKTTLLNTLGALTRPDQGEIVIDRQNLLAMTDRELSRFRARRVGFAFQFASMLPALTALENALLPFAFNPAAADPARARELLCRAGLEDRLFSRAHQLSAGQQRRVCVARALVARPRLLLCDEPTGDLDPDTESTIIGMIQEAHREGATVVMTTHNLDLVRFGSRRAIMDKGRLRMAPESGTWEDENEAN